MYRTHRTLLAALPLTLLIVATHLAAAAQAVDAFDITYGQTISDGEPAAGAGNIEVGGATDSYQFEGEAGDVAIFDVLVGSAGTFFWRLEAPSGAVLFDAFFTDRNRQLPETGTYVLTVRGSTSATSGTYSFRLLLTPLPQEFTLALGDTVDDGVPGPGAGSIEVPGAVDRYRFEAAAGQTVIFDALSGSASQISWSLQAPDGTGVFDAFYVDQEWTLQQTGTYVLTVRGLNVASSGVYSFRLLLSTLPQEFQIAFGDTVSDGVPATGAGNVEAPGAIDRYHFAGSTGQVALFDALDGNTSQIAWRLEAPDGTVLFDTFFVDQQVTLPETGTYALIVSGLNVTGFGTYSFRLVDVQPQVDQFPIAVGDTVADGVPGPGAGNLEGPGATDRYLFAGTAGQVVRFEVLAGNSSEVVWRLQAPGGTELFDAFYVDQQVTLTDTGAYVLEVSGLSITSFGIYSFRLHEPPPNSAPVARDDTAETEHDRPVSIDVLANDDDPDGDPLTIDAVTEPSNGAAVIEGGRITYTPAPGFFGPDAFTYTISDGRGGSDQATVSVVVAAPVPPANEPPSIGAIADQENTAGDGVDLQVQATDPDGDTLDYAAAGLPPGLTIDPASGHIGGTIATTADAGSPYLVQVTATDQEGATASADFRWIVHPPGTVALTVRIRIVAPCMFVHGFGIFPVVIYGDEQFDGRDVDLATVAFEGMPVKRILGRYVGVVGDVDGDGISDVLVLVDGRAGAISDATTATLTGQLKDGSTIEGSDDRCALSLARG